PSSWDDPNRGQGRLIWTNSQGKAHSGADVFLERSFPQVLENAWAYFTSPKISKVYRITKLHEQSLADYNMSGKSIALTLNQDADEGPVGLSSPAAVSWGKNRLDVFAIQSDGHVYHRYYDGQKWNGPDKLPGGSTMSGSPAAVSWGPNRIDV